MTAGGQLEQASPGPQTPPARLPSKACRPALPARPPFLASCHCRQYMSAKSTLCMGVNPLHAPPLVSSPMFSFRDGMKQSLHQHQGLLLPVSLFHDSSNALQQHQAPVKAVWRHCPLTKLRSEGLLKVGQQESNSPGGPSCKR